MTSQTTLTATQAQWYISGDDGLTWEAIDADDLPTDLVEVYGQPGLYLDRCELLYREGGEEG